MITRFKELAEMYGTTTVLVEALYYRYMNMDKVEDELKRLFADRRRDTNRS